MHVCLCTIAAGVKQSIRRAEPPETRVSAAATHVVKAAARLAPSQGRLSNPSADAKSGLRTVQHLDRVVDRIAWFHVPKTGSSFANTLMHLANASLPANAFLQNKSHDLKEMVRKFPMDTWFRIKFWRLCARLVFWYLLRRQ